MMKLILSTLFAVSTAFAGTQVIIPKTDLIDGIDTYKNFMGNKGHFEKNVGSFAAYADAAGTSPVDGTAGSPASTCTRSTSSPISGDGNLLITKSANNRQGEGCSVSVAVDSDYKAKVLSLKFKYQVGSGTFVAGTPTTDSDVTVWIYDVTNSTLIQPSSYKLLSNTTTLAEEFQAEFQTASNSTSYRLIFHMGSTSASAYTLKIDDIKVTPSRYVYGTPISDWASYTPTMTGFGTPTNVSFRYRRVADSYEVIGTYTEGTTTAVVGSLTLPNGASIDTNKIPIANTTANPGLIVGTYANSTTGFGSLVTATGTSSSVVYFTANNGGASFLTPAASTSASIAGNGLVMSVNFRVPIAGLSSNVQMTDQSSTRVVAFSAYKNGGAWSANVIIPSWTEENDTHGGFDPTTGVYTVQVPGNYILVANISSTSGTPVPYASKNTTRTINCNSAGGGAACAGMFPDLKVGDTIDMRSESALTSASGINSTRFSLTRVSGPSQILASEKVSFSGYLASSTAITANVTNVPWTSEKDTHSANSAGLYTVPMAGDYLYSVSWIAGGTGSCSVYKNASIYKKIAGINNAAWSSGSILASGLVAGDTLSARCDTTVTVTGSATVSAASVVSIFRVPGAN